MVDLFITIGLSLLFLSTILVTKSIAIGLLLLAIAFFSVFFGIRTPASLLVHARNAVMTYLREHHRYRVIGAGLLGAVFLIPAIGFPSAFMIFMVLMGILLRLQSTVFFGIAGGLLVAAPFFLSVREETLAESVALLSYYFLCIGVVWEGIQQLVHVALPHVSFRWEKPTLPTCSLPKVSLPTIAVEIPTLPTIVLDKPHSSIPSFAFRLPPIWTARRSHTAIAHSPVTEPTLPLSVAQMPKENSRLDTKVNPVLEHLHTVLEAFLDLTDMSRLYRRIPGYAWFVQIHDACAKPLITIPIPSKISIALAGEKIKLSIQALWHKQTTAVSETVVHMGEQLPLSFGPHAPSEQPVSPAPNLQTIPAISPSIQQKNRVIVPARSQRLRMITVETEDIGPMIHLPHLTMPTVSLPRWDAWGERIYRWQKTRLVWPSFRIRFVLPTMRIPLLFSSSHRPLYATVQPSHGSGKMTEEHMQFLKEYRRIQMKQKFPRFQIKIKLPHALSWPSVLTPKKRSHTAPQVKKKSAQPLPVVRVKFQAPSCVMQIQKTVVQTTQALDASLMHCWEQRCHRVQHGVHTIVSIPKRFFQNMQHQVMRMNAWGIARYTSISMAITNRYRQIQTALMAGIAHIRQTKETFVSVLHHRVETMRRYYKRSIAIAIGIYKFFASHMRHLTMHVRTGIRQGKNVSTSLFIKALPHYWRRMQSRLNQTWSYSFRIVFPRGEKQKKQQGDMYGLEDMFALLPLVASQNMIPSVNLFRTRTPFFERVEDMLAVLPVFAPSDRIPSLNLFSQSRQKQSFPNMVSMVSTVSIAPWIVYACLGSAFVCGILYNIMR